jgi:hypothetical protein
MVITTYVQHVERSYRKTLPNSAASEHSHVETLAKRLDSVEVDDVLETVHSYKI